MRFSREIISTFATVVTAIAALMLAPASGLADHKFPRNLSANGPWKTNLQWITAPLNRGFKVDDRGRTLAVDQAGVPALITADAGLRAYFQWAPTDDGTIRYFDHIAFSDLVEDGWTEPQIVTFDADFSQRDQHLYPFDPTVVRLEDARYRMYFTRNNSASRPPKRDFSLSSAISDDGLHFRLEDGDRLKLEDGPINDCAVIFFNGLWHLISPDHSNIGVAYYATSQDGLFFERQDNLFFDGGAWLGNMVENEGTVYFFGTGFTLKTTDFSHWQLVDRNRFADAGVALFDGQIHMLSVGR